MVLILAQHPNIVGIKLTCANIGKLHRITSTLPSSEFAVFAGKSDILLQGLCSRQFLFFPPPHNFSTGLLSGSAGGITGVVNIAPKVHVQLFKHFQSGNLEEAWKLQRMLAHADWAGAKLGPISGVKAVVASQFNYGSPRVRAPLKPRQEADIQSLGGLGKLGDLIELERSL